MSSFTQFFAGKQSWVGKPVIVMEDGVRFTCTLKGVLVATVLSKKRAARIATFNVTILSEEPRTHIRSDQVTERSFCVDLEGFQPLIEKRTNGNIFFKCGKFMGVIVLSGEIEDFLKDPTEEEHREPGTQHL